MYVGARREDVGDGEWAMTMPINTIKTVFCTAQSDGT